jgi:cytoskeletal protein RodZ
MNESIGAKLKQARELRRLTLQQVSDTTKVRPHYLQALENDDLSAISSVAQARGFLRIYAEFLGLTPADLVPPVNIKASPVPQSSNSSVDYPAASSKVVISTDKAARTGVLMNFLSRFRRPVEKVSTITENAEITAPVETLKNSELKPFIPARVKEDLPETPVQDVATKPIAINPETTGQIPIKEATTKTRTTKKGAPRPRKSSSTVDEKNEVKKKAGE